MSAARSWRHVPVASPPSGARGTGAAGPGATLPWADILMSAIAAVSWALIGMGGTAALGLHLLRADSAGSLGPMTAAVVALGAGGSVSPSGDVSAFGLKGAQTHTAIEITPLGVSLAGALLLSWFFLRSLRTAGVEIGPAELLARAGTVVALFVAMLGGLAWAGHDVITLDGAALGVGGLPGAGGGNGGGIGIPGLGDIGGQLPHRIGDLIHARAAVGFTVNTAATLLGGLAWSAGVLLIALLASRRTPLPRGWDAVHRVVRPAVSALVTVQLAAVAAGLTAGAYAALGDDHPRRIAGAALLGAPNGVWLGVTLGLFVPWTGRATGPLATLLPHPLDQFLTTRPDRPVTLGRLAGMDGRIWLLTVAATLLMLLAGVLTAVRTPGAGRPGGPRTPGSPGGPRLVTLCAVRLALATALTLPLLALLTDVTANASLSVLGFDAFGAGLDLRGHLGTALLLGAAWGAGAGAAGAALAGVCGVAGARAAALPRGGAAGAGSGEVEDEGETGARSAPDGVEGAEDGPEPGPYRPRSPYRPPSPGTNPYLRLPEEGVREEPEDARPGSGSPPGDDLSGAPTVAGPLGAAPPAPRSPREGPRAGRGRRSPRCPDTWPPPPPPRPPPPPPPAPPGGGGGRGR